MRRRRQRGKASAASTTEADAPHGEASLVLGREHLARVVYAGIESAQVDLAIATADFKAMLVPEDGGSRARSIIAVLRALAKRGVEVRVLHAGVPSSAALDELCEALPEELTLRRCPRVHTKAVIVDAAWMYLGSANLTGAGLGAKSPTRRNFEAGVCSAAPELIDPVLTWFDELWEGALCEDCGRREHCPVPLEEPELR